MSELAFSRVSFAIVSRADRGGSAVKAAAYNLCGRLQHDDHRYDFRRKAPEHQAHAVLLPPGAPPAFRDPGMLWRAAEAAEKRHDAQVARQILLSIPREIAAVDRLAFAEAVAAPWIADGAAAQIDIHCPPAVDGEAQPHAHILLSLRRVNDEGFAKAKAREWNVAFRQNGGRAERHRIEERGNGWLAAHGIGSRLDMRSNAARGIDMPPEPIAPRDAWEGWKRGGSDPATAPPPVAVVLNHRRRRHRLAAVETIQIAAAAEVATLEAAVAAEAVSRATPAPAPDRASDRPSGRAPTALSRLPTTSGHTDKKAPPREKPKMQMEPWMRGTTGFDGLSDSLQASARNSYAKWVKRKPSLGERHTLEDYVSYVQDRHAEAKEPDTMNGVQDGRREQGRARRHAHLESLLAEQYQAPAELAHLVRHFSTDPARGFAVLHLDGGVRLIDHGDRIEHVGTVTRESAEAAAVAAAAHGWERVKVTGSPDFRDAVACACALREPPIVTDHILPRAARVRVEEALRARAADRIPQLDADTVSAAAAVDPKQAAAIVVDHAAARADAALAGRPPGSTSADRIAAPGLDDLAIRCTQASDDARDATAAAASHRASHGWIARLRDPTIVQRQAALDQAAATLTTAAATLVEERPRHEQAIRDAAQAEARATAAAQREWAEAPHVQAASRNRRACAQMRQAISSGDDQVVAMAAKGDLRSAVAAAKTKPTTVPARQAQPDDRDDRAKAIATLHAAEQSARPGADLVRARAATAAAVGGDQATIAAAAAGDMPAATQAAADYQRAQMATRAAAQAARQRTDAQKARTPGYGT